jgi:hypothetical protein
MAIGDAQRLREIVDAAVREVKITDVHTHLYPPSFGGLLLWGVDELVTYHYLIAETLRWVDLPYEDYWRLSKRAQADLIWRTLFLEHSPYSESCRGVLTTLSRLGLDVGSRDLESYRAYFADRTAEQYVGIVFELAGVKDVIMTNDPFDDAEREVWLQGGRVDPRFRAALRMDALLNTWPVACEKLAAWGYRVKPVLGEATFKEVRRFLTDWVPRMGALYLAVSLPPTFLMPEQSDRAALIEECVLPVSRELNVPFAMMLGVKKLVNSALQLAGDSVGRARIEAVEYLCAQHPQNKFLVTMLSRENQHELAVAARKFRNLMIFGCWWFLNNPSLVAEITRIRCELLGVSMIPQHSDARVLDQLIYKWQHSRAVIADVLYDRYRDLIATGWRLEEGEIRRDVQQLFGGNFWSFLERRL